MAAGLPLMPPPPSPLGSTGPLGPAPALTSPLTRGGVAIEPRLDWQAEALWERLRRHLPGLSVEVLPQVASTNALLLERASPRGGRRDVGRGNARDGGSGPDLAGDADGRGDRGADGVQVRRSVESAAFGRRAGDFEPCLLVAERQLAGRGRMGRRWQSEAGASLTFSLLLPLGPMGAQGLSLAVGVALADALDPLGDGDGAGDAARLGLKWPNDLLLATGPADGAGRKLGGILVETVAAGAHRLAVIGVGLNVRPLSGAPPAGFSSGFASLDELDPDATAPSVLARIAEPLVEAALLATRSGFAPFAARFAARDRLLGRAVTTTSADVPEGVARGLDGSGALRIERADGSRVTVSSGEVSVRPVEAAGG